MIYRQQESIAMQNPIKAGNPSSLSHHQNNLPKNRYQRTNYFCTVFYCSPESHCAYRICKVNFRKQVSLYRFQIRPWRTFQKKKCIKSLLTSQLILTAWYFSKEKKKKKQFSFLTTPPCSISCRYYLFENSKPMSWYVSQVRQSPKSLQHFFLL